MQHQNTTITLVAALKLQHLQASNEILWTEAHLSQRTLQRRCVPQRVTASQTQILGASQVCRMQGSSTTMSKTKKRKWTLRDLLCNRARRGSATNHQAEEDITKERTSEELNDVKASTERECGSRTLRGKQE